MEAYSRKTCTITNLNFHDPVFQYSLKSDEWQKTNLEQKIVIYIHTTEIFPFLKFYIHSSRGFNSRPAKFISLPVRGQRDNQLVIRVTQKYCFRWRLLLCSSFSLQKTCYTVLFPPVKNLLYSRLSPIIGFPFTFLVQILWKKNYGRSNGIRIQMKVL